MRNRAGVVSDLFICGETDRTSSLRFFPLPQFRQQQVALFLPRDVESLSDPARSLVDAIRIKLHSLATARLDDRACPVASDEKCLPAVPEATSVSTVGADSA